MSNVYDFTVKDRAGNEVSLPLCFILSHHALYLPIHLLLFHPFFKRTGAAHRF